MARHYRGKTIDIDSARGAWSPRLLWRDDGVWDDDADLRIRIPGQAGVDDFDELIRIANDHGASDITVQVGEPVHVKIGSAWHKMTARNLTVGEVEMFLNETYDKTGQGEVAQRGRPVDYAFVVRPKEERKLEDKKLRLRSNATGGRDPSSDSSQVSNGVQISLRLLPGVPNTLEERGVDQDIIDRFIPDRGLFFVTGPTGSGKTTLLGGAIRYMAEDPHNSIKILEYSAPIELVYDELTFPRSHLHQVEVGRAIRLRPEEGGMAMAWASCVANAMRRLPEVFVIGEARDAPTIEGCVLAAMTGHGVLSTMHTIGAAETLRRAVMALPPDQRMAVAIDMIETAAMFVSQLLVPKIGGGRVAVREYVIFDAKARRRLVSAPLEHWTGLLQDMMVAGEVQSRRMVDHAKQLMDEKLIDEGDFEKIAARQNLAERRPATILADAPAIRMTGEDDSRIRFDTDLDRTSGVDADLVTRVPEHD